MVARLSLGLSAWVESQQNLPHHAAIQIRQAHVPAPEAIRELFVIETEQVQHGGVPVVDMDFAGDGFVAVFVGFTVGDTTFDAAAGHPEGVAFVIVVASVAIG